MNISDSLGPSTPHWVKGGICGRESSPSLFSPWRIEREWRFTAVNHPLEDGDSRPWPALWPLIHPLFGVGRGGGNKPELAAFFQQEDNIFLWTVGAKRAGDGSYRQGAEIQ